MIFNTEICAPMVAIEAYGDDYIEHLKNLLSKRMAEGVLDLLAREPSITIVKQDLKTFSDFGRDEVTYRASFEWKSLVKCKECKHRPFGLPIPDGVCPYYHNDDGYYSEFPPDDFYCANGEREEKTDAEIH